MAVFIDVEVTMVDGKTSCNPDPVTLHFDAPQGPDSVAWFFRDSLQHLTPEFSWDPECPFATMRDNPVAGKVEGTDNTKKEGDYTYRIAFKDARGNSVATLDPMIQNRRL